MKTEWGSSKDPALVHRQSPLAKGLPRAQREGQTSGNTSKRGQEYQDPRPLKRRRKENTEGPEAEGPANSEEQGLSPTSPRSRWERWQSTRPPTPPQGNKTPTRSGVQGSLAQGQVGPPIQGREGPGAGKSVQERRTRKRREPPEERDLRDPLIPRSPPGKARERT